MRLTKDQRNCYKHILSPWRSPKEMVAIADRLFSWLGPADSFNQPGVGFVREAWVADSFCMARGAQSVGLIVEERPDFALRFENDTQEYYELVEADTPDRRRGAEYKKAERAGHVPCNVSIEQCADPQKALQIIQDAVTEKIRRAEELNRNGNPYPPDTRLLIYLNIGSSGMQQLEIENIFDQPVEQARRWFSAAWIFWQNRAYEA